APERPAGRVRAPAAPIQPSRRSGATQLSLLDPDGFQLPPVDLLSPPRTQPGAAPRISTDALEQNARLLEGVLEDFGIKGEILNVHPGPVVTLYELEPAPGIKSSRVIGLADDIARSMSAVAARVAVIPGKNAIGIELPNSTRETVFLRELIDSQDFERTKSRLALALGKTIGGEPVIVDLARTPHMLVAGTTGSGKSVSINTMILSLLYRLTPEECRLIMIDPKMLELSVYDGIPHLLSPVVTDPRKAVVALKWTVREMEDRYKKMSKIGVRNIEGYNARVLQAAEKGETLARTVQTGFDARSGEPIFETEEMELGPLPFIVVIIDEMADLMMVAGKEIEGAVQRLAQMARAAGIHVVMATQRPSVDVITGTIKANFPTRISFQVTSKIDSRTILGEQGAEQLLGQGDMLYMAGGGRIQRVHGPFVSDQEVEAIVAHLKTQGAPDYLEAITAEEDEDGGDGPASGETWPNGTGEDGGADLYDQAVAVVLRDKRATTSYIQRRLGIGYNRAASLIERMEKEGLVGPANHAGKREILVEGGEE
ncbi:DNA translocase FtsK, partial [Oharaeibacter diazotrophicus]